MTPLIGRALQLVGMIVLPVGLYIGAVRGDVRQEVKLLAIGGFVFLLGWLLAKKD
ncbi:MAG TPA: hypothetical protein VF698_01100 [Thermoanaerobaculia bacterium]|jgi:hypothetical protein